MKKILFLLLFLCLHYLGYAQIITIRDYDTQQPLERVGLSSNHPAGVATTNVRGQSDITAFKDSEAIEIRLFGYKTEVLSYNTIKEAGYQVFLKPPQMTLDEFVISATRWEQQKRDVPAKISTITTKEATLQNPQTAADLLGINGEVFIQKSQQAGGSPMIRGFSTNRLLYAIDGVRMNTAIFRAGNLQNVISLDPFAIEHTEVFFGPGSIIYGSDAIGGVMSFRTLTPQFSASDKPLLTGKAIARFSGANSENTGHFAINAGWKKWAISASISNNKFGDLQMGSKGPDAYLKPFYIQRMDGTDKVMVNDNPRVQRPSGYSQTNMMYKIRFSPIDKWDFQYGLHYSETSEYARYDRLIETTANGLPVNAVWNYGPQKWTMHHLSITHSAANKLYDRFTLRAALQYFEESRIDRRYNNTRLRTQLEQVDAYSLNADFAKSFSKSKIYYGLEFVRNDVTSAGSAYNIVTLAPIKVPDRYPKSDWSSYAAYVTSQHRFNEKFSLSTGLRYNHYIIHSDFTRLLEFYPIGFNHTKINNKAITGSAGLTYSPTRSWALSANISTGFRAPNVDDMGKIFDFTTGNVVVPNPDLEAEFATSGEINFSKLFGEEVKFDMAAYYTLLDKAMVRRGYLLNGKDSIMYNGVPSKVFAIQNAAVATVYGINAGIEVKLPGGFGIYSRFNYQLGEEEMDDGAISRSRHATPRFGLARLSYQAGRLNMQFYALFNDEVNYENLNPEERLKLAIYAKDDKGNPYSPAWHTLNFKALYQVTENFTVSTGLENITDRRYRPYSSGMAAPGRNFILSMHANF